MEMTRYKRKRDEEQEERTVILFSTHVDFIQIQEKSLPFHIHLHGSEAATAAV